MAIVTEGVGSVSVGSHARHELKEYETRETARKVSEAEYQRSEQERLADIERLKGYETDLQKYLGLKESRISYWTSESASINIESTNLANQREAIGRQYAGQTGIDWTRINAEYEARQREIAERVNAISREKAEIESKISESKQGIMSIYAKYDVPQSDVQQTQANIKGYESYLEDLQSYYSAKEDIRTRDVTLSRIQTMRESGVYGRPQGWEKFTAQQQKQWYETGEKPSPVGWTYAKGTQQPMYAEPKTTVITQQQMAQGTITADPVTKQIVSQEGKNMFQTLTERGYKQEDVDVFLKQFETAQPMSYQIMETTVETPIGTQSTLSAVGKDITTLERVQQIQTSATKPEKMALFYSTLFSKRGLELTAKTFVKGKETPDDVIQRHMVDSITQEHFVTKTAIGSIYGSPSGVIATSMLGGAGITAVGKSAAVGRLVAKYPSLIIAGKVTGAGLVTMYAGGRGYEMYQAREDRQKLAELGIRTGMEVGGFIAGAKAQQEWIIQQKPLQVSVSSVKTEAVTEQGKDLIKAQTDMVTKAGDQTIQSDITSRATVGKFEKGTAEYKGIYGEVYETQLQRPELSKIAGQPVVQTQRGISYGGFGGKISKVGTTRVGEIEMPVYKFEQTTMAKTGADEMAVILQKGFSEQIFKGEPSGIAMVKVGSEKFVFTNVDVFKVSSTGADVLRITTKPSGYEFTGGQGVDISKGSAVIYEKASPEWIKTIGQQRYNEMMIERQGVVPKVTELKVSQGVVPKVTELKVSQGIRTIFGEETPQTVKLVPDIMKASGSSMTESIVRTSAFTSQSKMITKPMDKSMLGLLSGTSFRTGLKEQEKQSFREISMTKQVLKPEEKFVPTVESGFKEGEMTGKATWSGVMPVQAVMLVQAVMPEVISDIQPVTSPVTEPVSFPPSATIKIPRETTPFLVPPINPPDFFYQGKSKKGRGRKSKYTEKFHWTMKMPKFIFGGKK